MGTAWLPREVEIYSRLGLERLPRPGRCKLYLSFRYWWNYFDSNSGMSTSLVLLFLKSCLSTFGVCLRSLAVTLRWIHDWFLDQDFFSETLTPTTTGTTTTSTASTKEPPLLQSRLQARHRLLQFRRLRRVLLGSAFLLVPGCWLLWRSWDLSFKNTYSNSIIVESEIEWEGMRKHLWMT